MAHAGRALAQRAHASSAILYSDFIICGPSRLPCQTQRRTYETQRRRIAIPEYDHHVPNVPRHTEVFGTILEKPAHEHEQNEANEDSLTQRHKYMRYKDLIKLLNQGAIAEAMTRFKIACNEWKVARLDSNHDTASEYEISPHIINDLIIRLSRLARSPRRNWNDCNQILSRSSYWAPPYLPAHYDIRQVHVCALSFYALLEVYDISSSLGFLPSKGALSAIILALSHTSDKGHFVSGTTEILLRCSGKSVKDSEILLMSFEKANLIQHVDFKSIPLEVLCTLVKGYGKIGNAHQGEMMLERWSTSFSSSDAQNGNSIHQRLINQWKDAKDRGVANTKAPIGIDSSVWAKHIKVWVSLIEAREASCDLSGARYWLERYRSEGLAHHKASNLKECHQPHIAYLIACTRMRKVNVKREGDEDDLKTDAWIAGDMSRVTAVQEVVKTMHKDGTTIPVNVCVLLLNFYAGYNKIRQAQKIKEVIDISKISKEFLPRYYKGLFHLHCLEGLEGEEQDSKESKKTLQNVSTLRQDYMRFLELPLQWWHLWSNDLKRQILNHALRASLIYKDYPLASMILRTFKDRRLLIDHHIEIAMMTSLEPKRSKEIRKELKVQHHQEMIHANLLRILNESATEERPFEQFTITSKPKEWEADTNTPWHRLTRLIKHLDKYMISIMLKESQFKNVDWVREAKSKMKGHRLTHKAMVEVLLTPFVTSKVWPSPREKADSLISLEKTTSSSDDSTAST